jgi:hypothetical protein
LVDRELQSKLVIADDEKRILKLSMINYINEKGVRKLLLQARFWIVNNTGLPLLVRRVDDRNRIAAGQRIDRLQQLATKGSFLFCFVVSFSIGLHRYCKTPVLLVEDPFPCAMRGEVAREYLDAAPIMFSKPELRLKIADSRWSNDVNWLIVFSKSACW